MSALRIFDPYAFLANKGGTGTAEKPIETLATLATLAGEQPNASIGTSDVTIAPLQAESVDIIHISVSSPNEERTFKAAKAAKAAKVGDHHPEILRTNRSEIGAPAKHNHGPSTADLTWWRDEYEERAAHREFDGKRPREEAEALAWGELENRWNIEYGARVPRDICAGCRRPIRGGPALDLIDGNRVHDAVRNCLIQHEERWRRAATGALTEIGLARPST